MSIKLQFKKASKDEEIKSIFDYNIDAFIDSPDFNWTFDEIKGELKRGWTIYGVYLKEEVIAAVFLKEDLDSLLSKNTAIKMHYQGSGFSHRVKDFIEKRARELKLKKLIHYCRIDNFRTYSLNEGHGYKKSGNTFEDGVIVEWIKIL